MAKIIKTTGEEITIVPENSKDFKLEELSTIVGGYIEIVFLGPDKITKKQMILVVNEEGKLNRLPFNSKATQLYHNCVGPYDVIVGDVLYCEHKQVK